MKKIEYTYEAWCSALAQYKVRHRSVAKLFHLGRIYKGTRPGEPQTFVIFKPTGYYSKLSDPPSREDRPMERKFFMAFELLCSNNSSFTVTEYHLSVRFMGADSLVVDEIPVTDLPLYVGCTIYPAMERLLKGAADGY